MVVCCEFVGHATLVLDLDGTKVLVDPFFTSNPMTETDAANVEADVIMITHGHFDHIEDAVAIARSTGAKVIANFEIIGWLQGQGLPEAQCHPQHLGGRFAHDFGSVKLTIAHHGSGLPDGSYGGNPAGFLIEAAGKRIYITGDTALFSDMMLYGDVDLLVLPIGDNFTMGPEDAAACVQIVGARKVLPVHYNTWPLIEQDPQAFKQRVEAVDDAEVIVLSPGESLAV